MNVLEELISVLNGSEVRAFSHYLRSSSVSEGDHYEQLFQLLRENQVFDAHELATVLYGEPNLNAYHTLRKRLQKKLYVFLQTRRVAVGDDPRLSTSLVISALEVLVENDKAETAGKLLAKSKSLAMKAANYEGALDLLRFEIKYADRLRRDHTRMVDEWKSLHELVSTSQKVDLAYTTLRLKLHEVRQTGQLRSLDALVRKELDALGIDLNQDLPAVLVYQLMDIIRMAIVATKEYHQFEPLIDQTYSHLLTSGKLQPNDLQLRIAFTYMLAHAKFRTRKLSEAKVWVEQMKLLYSQTKRKDVRTFIARYYLLKASVLNFEGDNRKAIDVLQYALTRPELLTSERLNVLLNLSVFHFQTGDYKKAHQLINQIEQSDLRCEQLMGREWVFKKGLVEMIVLIELNYTELILTRMKSVKRLYKAFLNEPTNEWMGMFISAIQLMLQDPLNLSNQKVAKKLEAMLNYWPLYKEDLHALTFRSWLQSKTVNKPYYEVLLMNFRARSAFDHA
jgi:hypothetical protein